MTVTVLPVANYPAGSYSIPETSIGDEIVSLEISVKRCTSADLTIWPSTSATITFNLEVFAKGVWELWNSPASAAGGIQSVKGTETQFLYVAGSLPPGTGRKVRGSVVLSETIKTTATVTVA